MNPICNELNNQIIDKTLSNTKLLFLWFEDIFNILDNFDNKKDLLSELLDIKNSIIILNYHLIKPLVNEMHYSFMSEESRNIIEIMRRTEMAKGNEMIEKKIKQYENIKLKNLPHFTHHQYTEFMKVIENCRSILKKYIKQ